VEEVETSGGGNGPWGALLAPLCRQEHDARLLAFEVSRPWMEYTPQGRYCELYLDGTYYGVFILTEVRFQGQAPHQPR